MMEHELEKPGEKPKVTHLPNTILHTTSDHVMHSDKLGRLWITDLSTAKSRLVQVHEDTPNNPPIAQVDVVASEAPAPVAPSVYNDPQGAESSASCYARRKGEPYTRTCKVCGLGPCKWPDVGAAPGHDPVD